MRFILLPSLLGCLSIAHAFVGITIDKYKPLCAYACRSTIASAEIPCSPSTHLNRRHGHAASTVSQACRAVSAPFLSTLAYCINQYCFPLFNPSAATLEQYWAESATGDRTVAPIWGYQAALDRINGTPTAVYDKAAGMLNETSLVRKEDWEVASRDMDTIEWLETYNSRYSLTLLLVGVGMPILLTALTFLPFCSSLSHWLKTRYIYPTLTSRHIQPLFHIFQIPTSGQAIFITSFYILAIVLTAVEINPAGVSFFASRRIEVMSYISNRTGALGLALLPLTILFAGRNNILLWASNWSHATYLLLHRWVARLCALQIVIHSILQLVKAVETGTYAARLPKLYWIWGCIGTLAVVIMVCAAQFRRYYYEIFLITHILLAVFFVAGAWYHIAYLFTTTNSGYQYWIYLCCAVWFVDRLIRLGRVLKVGIKKAVLTAVGEEVVRVDIPGVRWSIVPGQHAYLYLPATRKWAPWENHPFSVIPTCLLSPALPSSSISADTSTSGLLSPDIDKAEKDLATPLPILNSAYPIHPPSPSTTAGITLFINRRKGLTASFTSSSTFSALLDGPYRNTSSRPVMRTDRLILFAGGVGITAILPFVHSHPNVKIYWSVRASQAALLEALQHTIPTHVERCVLVGERNDIDSALVEEVKAGWGMVGVVVCGPGGMCDQVRNTVARLGKGYPATRWELDVEAFLW